MSINIYQQPNFDDLTKQSNALRPTWRQKLGETDDTFTKRINIQKQADMLNSLPSIVRPSNNMQPDIQQVKNEQQEEKQMADLIAQVNGFKQQGNTTKTSYLKNLLNKKLPDRFSGLSTIGKIKQYTKPSDYTPNTTSRNERIMNAGNALAGIVGLFDRTEAGRDDARSMINQGYGDTMSGMKSDRELLNEANMYNREEDLRYNQLNNELGQFKLGNEYKLAGLMSGQDAAQADYDMKVRSGLDNQAQEKEQIGLKLMLSQLEGKNKLKDLLEALIAKNVMNREDPAWYDVTAKSQEENLVDLLVRAGLIEQSLNKK